ncbi:50S ribosomal protein L13 [bacterium]|nr:50S ribosomal protein L13 [bacterium]|tara:strand:+ start:697 stop:1062 length:366 start_codon:yes stop_codon:yes gene_type:complete
MTAKDSKVSKIELDASNQALGRLASQVATFLRGKHLVTFQPNIDPAVTVNVKNADKLKISDNKLDQKKYYRHSGYPGGLKTTVMRELYANDPEEVIRKAVFNMLPKNKLRSRMIKRLQFTK